jgi:hypothetical protein
MTKAPYEQAVAIIQNFVCNGATETMFQRPAPEGEPSAKNVNDL